MRASLCPWINYVGSARQRISNASSQRAQTTVAAPSSRRDGSDRVRPAPARLALAFRALIQHVAQSLVVAVLVDVVDPHVSVVFRVSKKEPR